MENAVDACGQGLADQLVGETVLSRCESYRRGSATGAAMRLRGPLGFVPVTYQGLLEGTSDRNRANVLRVGAGEAVLDLAALSEFAATAR